MSWLHSRWFDVFKYAVYLALLGNVGLFFAEEWQAYVLLSAERQFSWGELFVAFGASIDTLAWLILLLVFELETYQIPDEHLTGRVTAWLTGMRAVCYFFIVYAFFGYSVTALEVLEFTRVAAGDVCGQVSGQLLWLVTMDEYQPVANCAAQVAGMTQVMFDATNSVITSDAAYAEVLGLAIVDVINSGTWILVVVFLELDVRLLRAGGGNARLENLSRRIKYVLYATLLGCATYWGIYGSFLDFWDAFLWIVAFVFIERNVVFWEEELEANQAVAESRKKEVVDATH